MPLMEVKCPADHATPTSVPGPKLLIIRDAAIKDLISKIELILPNVAEASQDLSTLRGLFEEQLADAAALRSKSASSDQQGRIPKRTEETLTIGLDTGRPNYTAQLLQKNERERYVQTKMS